MDSRIIVIALICLNIVACGGGGSGNSTFPMPPESYAPTPIPSGNNNIHVQISPGSSVCSYKNAPCVTIKVCQPGSTSVCDTVNNVLVDTGSYGLRVFKSLLPNTANLLTPMMQSGESIAECVSYADGTGNWGPVESATVVLNGNNTTTAIPIQVLDASFPGMSTFCAGAVTNPTDFQLNGIIGIGSLKTDEMTSARYYKCNTNGNCAITFSPPEFVPNPISKLGAGLNNGATLVFSPLPQNGTKNADGYVIFGVASESSNTPESSVQILQIENGSIYPLNIITNFQSVNYDSFLDTGSNFLYFSNAILPNCTNSAYFCPSGFVTENAIMSGNNGQGGTSNIAFNFVIGNADALLHNNNTAFSNVGANVNLGNNIIDWGMPFYYGKTIYNVFAGESVTINGVNLPATTRGYWIY